MGRRQVLMRMWRGDGAGWTWCAWAHTLLLLLMLLVLLLLMMLLVLVVLTDVVEACQVHAVLTA